MAQFVFVRHGNTTKAEKDEDRVLTEVGKDQAREFRAIVKRNGLAPFDLVLTSPATRAKQTGAIIAPETDTVVLRQIGVEIPGEDGVRLNEVYGRLKYAPLTEYLEVPGMSGILSQYATVAGVVMEHAIFHTPRNPQCVLVVGHAVLLNTIGARWTKDDVVQDMRLSPLASVSLGECEGFVIKEDGSTELIRRD